MIKLDLIFEKCCDVERNRITYMVIGRSNEKEFFKKFGFSLSRDEIQFLDRKITEAMSEILDEWHINSTIFPYKIRLTSNDFELNKYIKSLWYLLQEYYYLLVPDNTSIIVYGPFIIEQEHVTDRTLIFSEKERGTRNVKN